MKNKKLYLIRHASKYIEGPYSEPELISKLSRWSEQTQIGVSGVGWFLLNEKELKEWVPLLVDTQLNSLNASDGATLPGVEIKALKEQHTVQVKKLLTKKLYFIGAVFLIIVAIWVYQNHL